MRKKYKHTTNVHNLTAPREIVKEILKHFSPLSVIDLWCWLWTFVKVFQENGVNALGIDGTWVNKKDLFIDEKYFEERDLEKEQDFWKKFDLAISFEVAEHLSESAAESFVKTIISASDCVLFAAALPLQGGQNHINEQSPIYWERLFNKYGYEFHDVFRHIFWNNDKIFRWYKQNMFLVTKKWFKIPNTLEERPPRYLVHPELYNEKMKILESPYKSIRHWIYLLYWKIKKWF